MHIWGQEIRLEISVPPSQFCCKPKTTLQNSLKTKKVYEEKVSDTDPLVWIIVNATNGSCWLFPPNFQTTYESMKLCQMMCCFLFKELI